jgi:putative ABC transport system ATP-binding protein
VASPISPILSVHHLGKTYKSAGKTLTVLQEIDFSLEKGSTNAIIGPSGSGKTTLLGICAGLDRPTRGEVILTGHSLTIMSEDELAELRNHSVGFIFQNFQLMASLTAVENVMVPLELRGDRQARQRSLELLAKVGLAERAHHYPVQLSGGEQQRVALARAFSNQPSILFADEPTGNLDAETSEMVVKLLFDLNREEGTTLVLVTHNADLAAQTQRVIRIKGGMLV